MDSTAPQNKQLGWESINHRNLRLCRIATCNTLHPRSPKERTYKGIAGDKKSQCSGSGEDSLVFIACPGIVVDDIASIFEEHHICQNINLHRCLQSIGCSGVYVEDEKKYLFHNVHVGDQAEARFKIINGGKVAADVLVSVKPVSNKAAARITDIFDVTPTRMNIPSYDHKFVVVTFTPQTMQNYQCIFEAVVEPTP
eukprot:g38679.t1